MRKIGKRLFGALMTAALVLTMSFSVLAAPSATTDGVVTEIVQAADKNGNDIMAMLEVQELPEEYRALAEEIRDVNKLREVLGSAYVEGMEVVDVRDVIIVGDKSLIEFPVTITFEVPGVLESTKVAVLHYVDGAWQVEPSKAGKGTITATFDSLSPVAFVVDKNTAASSVTSPTTGESASAAGVGMVVVIAAAGALLLRKRELVK